MPFSPYHCPKCGSAVVFRRMLSVQEAAYYCGYQVRTLENEMGTGKLKFKYWLKNDRWWRVIDTMDLLAWMDTKFVLPENLNDSLIPTKRLKRRMAASKASGVSRRARAERAAEARKAAAAQGLVVLGINVGQSSQQGGPEVI